MDTQKTPQELFGLRLAHVGINAADEVEAAAIAQLFSCLMGLETRETPVSLFSDTMVEIMKQPGAATSAFMWTIFPRQKSGLLPAALPSTNPAAAFCLQARPSWSTLSSLSAALPSISPVTSKGLRPGFSAALRPSCSGTYYRK